MRFQVWFPWAGQQYHNLCGVGPMKASRSDVIKKEVIEIYFAIRDLTDDDVLKGYEGRFRQHFERLQRLIAMDI
jgi:hypothetical protein